MKNIKKVLKSLKLKNGTRLLSLLVTLLAVSLTKNNVNLVKAEAETVDAILQQKRIPTLQDDFDDNMDDIMKSINKSKVEYPQSDERIKTNFVR